jgi:hypothetical protein
MRCAHRNDLLMSAPELADELRDACGPPESWRLDDVDEPGEDQPRAGTEVYDASDDEDDDDDDLPAGPVGPLSVHALAARARSPQVKTPPSAVHATQARPKTEIEKFAGVELTSIINMMEDDDAGSKPLVDLNVAPTLDSGPRRVEVDSDPALGAFVSSLPMTQRNTSPPPPTRPPNERPRPTGERPRPTGERPFPSSPDLAEIMPTAPRRVSREGESSYRPPAEATAVTKRKESAGFALRPWMVIIALILVAGIAALVVAMSGPNVPSGK